MTGKAENQILQDNLAGKDKSDVLDDFTRFETAGADLHSLDSTAYQGPHLKQIRIPGSPCAVFSVGNVVAKGSSLSANFAFSGHCVTPSGILNRSIHGVHLRCKYMIYIDRGES